MFSNGKNNTATVFLVPRGGGGDKTNGSGNQRRNIQGREKSRPTTLMLWKIEHRFLTEAIISNNRKNVLLNIFIYTENDIESNKITPKINL